MHLSTHSRRLAAGVLGAIALAAAGCGVPPETENASLTAVASGPTTAPIAAPVDAAEATGDAANGKVLFVSCAACHGPDAKGLPNLGKDLTTSTFVKDKSDAELLAFLKVGRDASDPLNTTGVAMPPKGGNPVLQDPDLGDLVAYMRELQGAP